ncbi:hypothetical protein ABI59_22265 [Acidobacteria bacterium Mor1]|nr:hypothetical protein ABI59_22265 [Acidobacteria bacterium Mor1]
MAFETTKWSLVLAAREPSDPSGREALAELCSIYWYPLYAFVRRRTGDADAARDLTQGFFADLLERSAFDRVDPAAGRFRSFLLASFKNFLSHERERAAAQKRGGGTSPVSLDADEAEERYRFEPADDRTPERVFERSWALAVLDQVSGRLRSELIEAGKAGQYDALSGYLTGEGDKPYKQVAEELGTSEAAVKMAVRRLRQRYGTLLREEIAHTVTDEDQVDRELKHLLTTVQEG